MTYDIAVVGGGPAGTAAAITAASQNCKVVLFEAHGFSPRLRSAKRILNYMGIPDVSGTELMDKFTGHLRKMPVDIVEEKVVRLIRDEGRFTLQTSEGTYDAHTVVVATGVSRSRAITGEREFIGRGVSFSAKLDAAKFKGQRVAAIATVPDALAEVEYLADFAEEVFYLPRFADYENPNKKNIRIILDPPSEITGTDAVNGLRTENDYYAVKGVFMFRASDPFNSFLPDLELSGRSIAVDDQAQTNIAGVFAGGDCTGHPWQVNRAAGQGQKAALSAIRYLSKTNVKLTAEDAKRI